MREGHVPIAGRTRAGLIAALAGVCASSAPAAIIYVRSGATGPGNGSSWANAFPDLQAALAAASAGDQIWVAAGTYKRSEEHTSELQSHSDLRSFPTRRSSDLSPGEHGRD